MHAALDANERRHDNDAPSCGGGPRTSRLKRAVFVAGATAGALVGAALLLEIGLWVFAPIPFHEWLVWEAEGHIRTRPVPDQDIATATGSIVHINKYGFRGPDYAYEKTPGTLRLAVFGGSAAFCYHTNGEDRTWPAILGTNLEDALQMPVEVINLALPGFDSFNSKVNYMCFGRAFHPDAIIVYHTWNDFKVFRTVAHTPYKPATGVPQRPLWQRIARMTQLGRHGRQIVWTARRRKMEARITANELDASFDEPVDEKAYAWERRNFADFVALARSDGVLPILVTQATSCVPQQQETLEGRTMLTAVPFTTGISASLIFEAWPRVNEIIADVTKQGDAILVDGYSAVPHDFEHLRDHVHLSDKGCQVLSERIAQVLLEDRRFGALVAKVRGERRAPH